MILRGLTLRNVAALSLTICNRFLLILWEQDLI